MDSNFSHIGRGHHTFERPGSDIRRAGYLRKLKTNKKKFFVLRSTSSSGPARLEYYDTEKKFLSGTLPKRFIHLHTCFNINKKADGRSHGSTGRFGIVLYTVQDSFAVVAETEAEQDAWLAIMLEFQYEYQPEDSNVQRDHYEHVWPVTMQARGLGQAKGLKGQYRLCLTNTTVSLFRVSTTAPQFVIQLVTIRSVAHNENSFCLELGNYASTGPGSFWFAVEDTTVAKDLHTTILDYMISVKDIFKKDQHFGYNKRDNHASSFHDDFGGFGSHSINSDRRSLTSRSMYFDDDYMDYSMDHMDHSKGHDLDTSTYCGPSLHGHIFSELLHTSHLPTVKEGGSGEGHLLSDLPPDVINDCSQLPRPEPAPCMVRDDSSTLPPRTYSLGSRPTKKFSSVMESGSRKGTGNEISRATSVPHIIRGRREREHNAAADTSGNTSLSSSFRSDDSDSLIECVPMMRPRTASDSYNSKTHSSSGFGKLPPNFRPRSSSYGQGKRPVVSYSKRNFGRAMVSQDSSQRTSRESSLPGSFESLRVSSENLRKTSAELRQSLLAHANELASQRNTPSPQTKLHRADQDFADRGVVDRPQYARADSSSSSVSIMGSDRQQSLPPHTQKDTGAEQEYVGFSPPVSNGNEKDGCYINFTPIASTGPDKDGNYVNFSPMASNGAEKNDSYVSFSPPASSGAERVGYVSVDLANQNQKPEKALYASNEEVDTYFIHDCGTKPRTGSVGSTEKQALKPPAVSVSAITSGFCSQEAKSFTSSTKGPFGSSDSIKKASQRPPSDQCGTQGKDFRKKSGSLGSRPTKMPCAISRGHENVAAKSVPTKKPSPKPPILIPPSLLQIPALPPSPVAETNISFKYISVCTSNRCHVCSCKLALGTVSQNDCSAASEAASSDVHGGPASSGIAANSSLPVGESYIVYEPNPLMRAEAPVPEAVHGDCRPQQRIDTRGLPIPNYAVEVNPTETLNNVNAQPAQASCSSSLSSNTTGNNTSSLSSAAAPLPPDYVEYDPYIPPKLHHYCESPMCAPDTATAAFYMRLKQIYSYQPNVPLDYEFGNQTLTLSAAVALVKSVTSPANAFEDSASWGPCSVHVRSNEPLPSTRYNLDDEASLALRQANVDTRYFKIFPFESEPPDISSMNLSNFSTPRPDRVICQLSNLLDYSTTNGSRVSPQTRAPSTNTVETTYAPSTNSVLDQAAATSATDTAPTTAGTQSCRSQTSKSGFKKKFKFSFKSETVKDARSASKHNSPDNSKSSKNPRQKRHSLGDIMSVIRGHRSEGENARLPDGATGVSELPACEINVGETGSQNLPDISQPTTRSLSLETVEQVVSDNSINSSGDCIEDSCSSNAVSQSNQGETDLNTRTNEPEKPH